MRCLLLLGLLVPGVASAAVPGAGQLVITEIMADASCQYNEWFEVYNPTSEPMELQDCVLSTGTSDHTVGESAIVPAGSYAVLYRSAASCGDVTQIDAAGAVPLLYKYGSFQLSNADLRDLTITCASTLVDTVNFDADAFRCSSDYGSCTIQLAPGSTPSAAANDDASVEGTWCSPDTADAYDDANPEGAQVALGTPAGPNRCGDGGETGGTDGGTDGTDGTDGGIDTGTPIVVPADVCRPGDFLISELMIAPKDPANADEWIELHGTGDTCNLHSCVLETWDAEEGLKDSHTIRAAGDSLQLSSGSQVVLARATSSDVEAGGISWKNEAGDTIAADYLYAYDVYLRSDPGEVRLICDGDLVDSAPIDWDLFSEGAAACPGGWCSVNVHPASLTAEANDDLARWCIPPVDGNRHTHTDPAGEVHELAGTIRKLNECPSYDWPGVGEAAFIEVQAAPQGTEEWFELANLTTREIELSLCTLERVKTAYDEEVGAEVTSDPTRYVLGIEGAEIRLDAGQIQVFAKNGCILPTGGGVDTGSESVSSDCSYGELFYGSLSFTADSDETLRLYCPSNAGEEILIDEINFNFTELGIREGHSLMFDGARLGAEAASLNDTASNWCEGAFSQQFYEAEEGECSYGSPGTAAPCVTDPLDPPKTVCRCAGVSGDPARALWPLLGLLGILGLRRRP